MIATAEHDTIGSALQKAAIAYRDLPLIAIPQNPERDYHPDGLELSYGEVATSVQTLADAYTATGFGLGHRVGLFLDNRPEHFLHKLALNTIGVCCVPINPDYRAAELAYLIDHAKLDLVVVLPSRRAALEQALVSTEQQPVIVAPDQVANQRSVVQRPAAPGSVNAATPSSILYTSGTTGRPKGCVLSHRYELAAGAWYANLGHLASIRTGQERLYNPLPQFHVNASILSFFCMLLSGGCHIQAERFQPTRWWHEVSQTRATIVHYLGVIVPMLLNQPVSPVQRAHRVRFGFGAGVEPSLHEQFEQRFGFPLLEIWGMTEIVRVLVDNEPPRQPGTRAFGRAQLGLEVRVADHLGSALPNGEVGEMLVRHSEAQPRKDFFSCYLDDEAATEQAWAGGWFHTGDMVTRDATGMLHFVDREKNIIRRSGENISAAEIEALLLTHPRVGQVAVLAVDDELREQEVLACIVLKAVDDELDDASRFKIAKQIFDFCFSQLAYYKAPGWVIFKDDIPKTGTQKIQKHRIFEAGTDPRSAPGVIDFRSLKKRRQ